MKVYTPGELRPGLYFLGNPAVLLYLLVGKKSCLIDSGMTAMGPLVRQGLEQHLGAIPNLDHHALTHSHYDHVGCTPLLRQENPRLPISAHPALADIVQRPNAISLIRRLNETVMGGPPSEDQPDMIPFSGFDVSYQLTDGERLDLGGLVAEVFFTPGHTRDSITYYIPEAKAIIPGEAAGVPDMQDRIMPEFLQSYQAYMASLERLSALDIEMICLPHNYVLAGDPAKSYIKRSIEAAIDFRVHIEQTLDSRHGDLDQAIAVLTERLYHAGLGQPKDAFSLNLSAMVNTVARECV